MNTLVVWLVLLMAAESSVSEFTDFESGMLWSLYYKKIILWKSQALFLVRVADLDTNETTNPVTKKKQYATVVPK